MTLDTGGRGGYSHCETTQHPSCSCQVAKVDQGVFFNVLEAIRVWRETSVASPQNVLSRVPAIMARPSLAIAPNDRWISATVCHVMDIQVWSLLTHIDEFVFPIESQSTSLARKGVQSTNRVFVVIERGKQNSPPFTAKPHIPGQVSRFNAIHHDKLIWAMA